MTAEDIFLKAVEKRVPIERAAFLDRACGTDAELRAEVEGLIASDKEASRFLEEPLFDGPTDTVDQPSISERPGTQIGRYKLLEKIGEGGFGVVFMAEQKEPVKRRVALKIIKPGMDTRQVIARFEAERQALAMMDHPNIAKVLDAGATESGRPYFVMELVKGMPITCFCDANRLAAHERIQLFVSVCQAVQHAHQKGIIHRDLKPSNVLVASYDDQPVPKIIDFGVAKATNQQLTERTLFTQVGQIVGTWEYMSPEQAVFNQLDVDTRSDVYSLGVLLYELLTSVTPLERERFRSIAFEEMLRIIREEEPPKPSMRVSSLGDAASATAIYRRSNSSTLAKSLRGDMDWIIMKALEKSRSRRYQTAGALAADLKHHLDGEPVDARAPSLAYKLQKIGSQHRIALTVSAIVILTLFVATVTTSWMAIKYRSAMAEYKGILRDLAEELTDRAMADVFSGDIVSAKESIAKARNAEAPEIVLDTLDAIAKYFDGDRRQAITTLTRATEKYPTDPLPLAALYFVRRDESEAYAVQARLAELPRQGRSKYERDYETLLICLPKAVRGETSDIAEVVESLDELIRRHRRWGVAYLTRASASMELGMESRNLNHFRRAIADIERAQVLLPAGDELNRTSIYIVTTSLECAREQESTADYDNWLRLGNEIAAKCHGKERIGMSHYFHVTGQGEQADMLETEFLEACKTVDKDWRFTNAAALFGAGTPDLAKRIEDARAQRESDLVRADFDLILGIALAAQSPSGREEAMEIFQRMRSLDLPGAYYGGLLEISLFVGCHDVARESAEVYLESPRLANEWRWFKYTIEHYAGLLSEDDLLRMAGPFSNARCMAHYSIGLKAFSRGDRKKAISHFEQVVATRQVRWYNYHLAQGLLLRMNEDATWPDWIEPSHAKKPTR